MGFTAVYDNVVLIGFMGSGKTSVAKVLARQLYKEFADVDSIIEAEQNASVNEIFQTKGEEYFRTLEQKCINELTQKKGQIIATGGLADLMCQVSETIEVVEPNLTLEGLRIISNSI